MEIKFLTDKMETLHANYLISKNDQQEVQYFMTEYILKHLKR